MNKKEADISGNRLKKISYSDKEIWLECYADTFVYKHEENDKRTLVAIRFGGYPEQVKAMESAIYGGGTIETDSANKRLKFDCMTKRYTRQIVTGEVYSECTIFAADEAVVPIERSSKEQTKMEAPPRKSYIFCKENDTNRLFAEIDKRVCVPLIPAFKDYLLEELQCRNILTKLEVKSVSEQFEAWELSCSSDDKNIISVVEDGLKKGKISIPMATQENSAVFKDVNTVSQYLKAFGAIIAERIKSQFVPLFDPATMPLSKEVLSVNDNIMSNTGYSLYDAQLAVAEAAKRKIDKGEPALIVAECGSGKTKIGATALYASHLMQGKTKTFNIVLCPSHITKKWAREVEETVPNAVADVVKSINGLKSFHRAYEKSNKTFFAVISKEKARDGYMHRPSAVWNDRKNAFRCPTCNEIIEEELSDDGIKYRVKASPNFFKKENSKNHKCEFCGSVLWEPLGSHEQSEWVKISDFGFAHRKFPLAGIDKVKSIKVSEELMQIAKYPDEHYVAAGAYRCFPISTYIKKKMKNKIDAVIVDELHQYNNSSGQGDAMAEIAGVAKKFVGMTATLINGYASGIFCLLYRLMPRLMRLDGKKFEAPLEFCKEYGVMESVFEIEYDYNSNRRSVKRGGRERMLPGVSPLVYSRFLLENAVFLSLSDMGKDLPEYEEIPIALKMRDDIQCEYERLEKTFREIMSKDKKIGKKILSAYMGLLTVYPDQPYEMKPIINPLCGDILEQAQDLSSFDECQQKDLEVMSIVSDKLAKGENVLIYTSWIRIDTQQKLYKLLTEKGYKTAVLEAKISPSKREEWLEKQIKSGVRVVICNQSLVETGLDLNFFTTLIYYNISYNLFTLRQSSRRSWRINQTAPRIEVYMFYYKGTMQNRAMRLMASKLAAATIIEGCVTDEGLAAMSDCRDLTSQLAKELTLGIQSEVEDIAAVYKKMAIIKPHVQQEIKPAIEVEKPIIKVQIEEKSVNNFVFATVASKKKAAVLIDNQLTLFDVQSA